MSGYRGRSGPNFTQFLDDLNAVSPSYDRDQFNPNEINIDDELAMFTNTNFTNIDLPPIANAGSAAFDFDDNANVNGDIKYEDLLAGTTSPSMLVDSSIETSPSDPVQFFPNYNTPIQPAPPANGFRVNPQPPSSVASSSTTSPQTPPSKKRKTDAPSPVVSAEEQSRLAAEEDKRRRNTAASARFRVKKKQREAALEHTVKEINDKNTELQTKVTRLEMENKWLKNLIVEKNGKESKEEIAAAFQQFRRESEECETRGDDVKKGVGTES